MNYLVYGSGQNVMNAGIQTVMTTGYANMTTTALALFNLVLPYAFAVVITIGVVTFGWAKFKKLSGLGKYVDQMEIDAEAEGEWSKEEHAMLVDRELKKIEHEHGYYDDD